MLIKLQPRFMFFWTTFVLVLVMVYLYGGGFVNGNNMITEYGPQYYLDQDIIVVIPNYR